MIDEFAVKAEPRRVLIIHADGNLFNNPSLKCIADLLLQRGCEIDFRYPKSLAPMPATKGIQLLPFGARLWRLKSFIFNRLCIYPLVFLSALLEQLFLYRKYDLIIGVDRQGLIEAGVLHKITRTPFVYISFEIMFESETSARCKRLEQRASRDVDFWVVQDEERAEQLQRENQLNPGNRFLLPLASSGGGEIAADRQRDRLGIPDDKHVAITIGSVADWSMTREIIRSVASWPDDWVLIVHERYGRTSQSLENALAEIVPLVGKKIFLSNAATDSVDDMGSIMSGVSVGLAFYKPVFIGPYLGKNLIHLGLASGKISTCLRYGVPVLVNEIGLFAKEAKAHQFGWVVESPESIGGSLARFHDARLGVNAKNYFMARLDFNCFENDLWARIAGAMATTAARLKK